MPDSIDVRRKTIGLLIRRARETAGRSRKDCGAFLGVSTATISKYEEGTREPSFLDIEMLAHYLRAPIQALLEENASSAITAPRMSFNVVEMIKLRCHIVGTRLRQARINANGSITQIASMVGITPAQLNAYELGKRPVPITEIERLVAVLNVPLSTLLDMGVGPVGEAQLQHLQHAQLNEFSPELRAFVTNPNAVPYLQVALRLSRMSPEQLRALGQALLDLTSTD